MKPRTVPARMSAKRRAQFEAQGRIPFSTIQRKENPCTIINAHIAKNTGGVLIRKKIAHSDPEQHAPNALRKAVGKRIPPRKKRTGTPILSTPWPNALDPRSYVLDGRVKLFGADKRAMRERIFARAGGRCEETVRLSEPMTDPISLKEFNYLRCGNPATEWSHKPCVHLKVGSGHGQGFKCDSELCGAAECSSCHKRSHGQY